MQRDICELLDEAFGMAGLSHRKRFETQRDYKEGCLKVSGNPVLIREALSNLFSNSMEAVEDGGLIDIGAYRVDGRVGIRISDDGAGIPEEKMAHLYEPFQTTKPNGHGLGLFAVKHIVEMHHGSIEIESVEGKGTSVTVSLPAVPSSDGGQEEGTDSPPSEQSR